MFRFGLLVGFGIGYLLGTKAGRERYYQIVRTWQSLTSDQRVQQVMEKGKAVVDLSAERAMHAVNEGLSTAARKVRPRGDDAVA